MPVEFRPVFSKYASEVGYDPETMEMHVRHANKGTVSVYAGVPPETFEQIANAPSVGQAIHTMLRGNYEHTPG